MFLVGKVTGARSFDGSIGHLACHQATFLTSLGEFNFFFLWFGLLPLHSWGVGH
jgi:hypothetical protein